MNEDLREPVAKALEHIAGGIREGAFEVGNIEMTQSANPTVRDDGKLEYIPSGEFTLVLTYKRKDI